MATRDSTQDILKGAAIILVVLSHMLRGMRDAAMLPTTGTYDLLDFILYTTHMPLFFMVAGYNAIGSLNHRGTRVYLHNRVWALVYPYIVWSFLLWGLKGVTDLLVSVNHPLGISDLLAIAWQPISPYWFLYALLLMQLVLVPFKNRAGALLLAATGMVVMIDTLPTQTLWSVAKATALHIPFFALGVWLASNRQTLISPRLKSPLAVLLMAALFSATIAVAYPLNVRPVGVVTLLASLTGIGLLGAFSLALPSGYVQKAFIYLGQCSFPIFLMHVIVTALSRIALPMAGITHTLLILVLGTALGVILPLVANAIALKIGTAGLLGLTGKNPLAKA